MESNDPFKVMENNFSKIIDEINRATKRNNRAMKNVAKYTKMATMIEEKRQVTASDRKLILEREKYHCKICHKSLYHGNWLIVDFHHIKPYHQGGKTNPNNVVALCPICHRIKHKTG